MITELEPRPSGPKVELIDGKFFSVRHLSGQLLASIAYSEFELEALLREIKHKYSLIDDTTHLHPIGSATLLTVGEGLQFYTLEEPFKTGSTGSESVYVAVARFDDCTFLVQYKHPNSRASWHWHLPGEHFVNRDGNSFIYEDEDKVLKLGSYRYVDPETPHLIYTLDQRAINLILHEGTDFNHNPVNKPRPSIEKLRELTIQAGLYPHD